MPRNTPIPRLDLPPKIDHREVAKAAKQYGDLRERHRVESQNLVEAEHAKDRAVERDRQAHADAIRAGKPDPGSAATAKAEQAIAEKAREVAVIEVAAKDAHRELLATVDRHREAWAKTVAERIEQRRSAVREALDAFELAYQKLREDVALRAWLDQFPEGRFRPGAGAVPALRRPSGDAMEFATVIDALRQMLDPPEHKPAPNVQPLRPVAHAS